MRGDQCQRARILSPKRPSRILIVLDVASISRITCRWIHRVADRQEVTSDTQPGQRSNGASLRSQASLPHCSAGR